MYIIFLIFLTTVFARSHEKYIDLLPEEEKQEFLDHVARRIMENVESKEAKNKFSRELTDEQLKEHNDFVQSILKQESLQMRRNKENNEDSKRSEENLEVKPLQADNPDDKIDSPDIDRIDLTVNDIKRRSFDDSYRESTADATKDDVSENQTLQKRSVETDDASTTERIKTDIDRVETTTEFLDLTVVRSNYTSPSPIGDQVTTIKPAGSLSKESDSDASVETLKNKEGNKTDKIETTSTKYITTTIKPEDVTKKANKTVLHKGIDSNITYILPGKKNITSVVEDKEAKSTNKTLGSSESSESDEDYSPVQYNNKTTESTLSSTLSVESTTESIKGTTYKTATESSTASVLEVNTTESHTTEHVTLSTVSPILTIATTMTIPTTSKRTNEAEASTTEKGVTETSTTVAETTTIPTTTTLPVPALTPADIIELSTKNPKKAKTKLSKEKKAVNGTVLSNVASNALQKLKDKYKKKKEENEQEYIHFKEVQKKIFKEIEGNSDCIFPTCKGYRVFEVHWPVSAENQTPFLRDSDPMIDQPYFVPVYNYSPNHVYYNPENRLGPNIVEENSIEINRESLRIGHVQENEVPERPEFIIDLDIDLMRKFGLYKKKPKEYKIATLPPTKPPGKKKKRTTTTTPEPFSEEQSVTEMQMHFPDSDEDLHPYNSLKNGMKSQLSLIRNVLFNNKHFVDPTDKNQRDYEEFLYGDKAKKNTNKDKKKKRKKLRTFIESDNKPLRKIKNIDYIFLKSKPYKKRKVKPIGLVLRSLGDVKKFFVDLFGGGGSKKSHKKSNKEEDNVAGKLDKRDKKSDKKYDRNRDSNNRNDYKPYNKFKSNKEHVLNKYKNNMNNANIRYSNSRYNSGHSRTIRGINNPRIWASPQSGKNKKNSNETENTKVDTISKILSMSPASDVFLNLKKMQDMNLSLMRRHSEAKFGQYMTVLKDMIQTDNKALKQYNWLTTTVQIQSALSKLSELLNAVREAKPVHPSDVQIMKYVVFLYNFASEIRTVGNFGGQVRNNMKLSRKRKPLDKKKELLNQVWLYTKTLMPDLTDEDELGNLEEFLTDLENSLFDLHNALKNIAKITKYRNQHWYENLKDLYLTTEEKQLREVLLHVSAARLVELLEYSCQNGLETDFVEFMKKNKQVAKRTLEEMLFVIKIIDEIKYSVH